MVLSKYVAGFVGGFAFHVFRYFVPLSRKLPHFTIQARSKFLWLFLEAAVIG